MVEYLLTPPSPQGERRAGRSGRREPGAGRSPWLLAGPGVHPVGLNGPRSSPCLPILSLKNKTGPIGNSQQDIANTHSQKGIANREYQYDIVLLIIIYVYIIMNYYYLLLLLVIIHGPCPGPGPAPPHVGGRWAVRPRGRRACPQRAPQRGPSTWLPTCPGPVHGRHVGDTGLAAHMSNQYIGNTNRQHQ